MLWATDTRERDVADKTADEAAAAATQSRPRSPGLANSMGIHLNVGLGDGHHGRPRRRCRHHGARGELAATLMRHYLQPAFAIALLPRGVSTPAITAGLVATTGLTKALTPSGRRAPMTAVALPSIAVPAQEEDLPAGRMRAGHKPQRFQTPPAGRVEVDDRSRACDLATAESQAPSFWFGRGLGVPAPRPHSLRPAARRPTTERLPRPVLGACLHTGTFRFPRILMSDDRDMKRRHHRQNRRSRRTRPEP